MILSPKEKFQQSQIRTSQWAQVLDMPVFDEAIDSSLLQMQSVMPVETEHQAYFASIKIAGAQEFVRILKTIHEKEKEFTAKEIKGLNYQAGV